MDVIARQLARQYPDTNDGRGIAILHWLTTKTRGLRPLLFVLLAGAVLLLLVGSLNVANLMLVRGSARQQELELRMALGATRRSLVRHLAAEAAVLAVLGGVLGVLSSIAALPTIIRLVSGSLAVNATQLPPQAALLHRSG